MNAGKSVSVRKLSAEVVNCVRIREILQEYDDPQLILDTIEGETDIHEAIAVIYEETAEDEILLAGLAEKLKELTARKQRVEKSIEDRRNIILMAMDRGGVKTVRTPLATLTHRDTPPSALIADEALIPARFWKPQEPVLDKRAVSDAIKAGEAVPGVNKSNGGISLSIRKV
jgi:hypothetical protein